MYWLPLSVSARSLNLDAHKDISNASNLKLYLVQVCEMPVALYDSSTMKWCHSGWIPKRRGDSIAKGLSINFCTFCRNGAMSTTQIWSQRILLPCRNSFPVALASKKSPLPSFEKCKDRQCMLNSLIIFVNYWAGPEIGTRLMRMCGTCQVTLNSTTICAEK